jgi:hypothetical protein
MKNYQYILIVSCAAVALIFAGLNTIDDIKKQDLMDAKLDSLVVQAHQMAREARTILHKFDSIDKTHKINKP